MLYRIKQVVYGLTAHMTSKDHSFVKAYLNDKEQRLFYNLRVGEQVHSVKVAYGCHEEFPQDSSLIKAALLHDIGKVQSNLTLVNKVLVVIISRFSIDDKYLPLFIKRGLYYKNNHPNIGAKLLEEIGTPSEIVEVVRKHHSNIQDVRVNTIQKFDDMY